GVPTTPRRSSKLDRVHPGRTGFRPSRPRPRDRSWSQCRAVSFLLDTNAVSEIRRGRDPNVRAWAGAVSDVELHLSVLTLGEIRTGIDRLRDRDRAQADVFATWLG